jgi:ribosomal protein L3 glutamine methyltransferase
MQLLSLIQESYDRLNLSKIQFGQGTTNAWDEAVWLVLWQLHLPLDTDLDTPAVSPTRCLSHQGSVVTGRIVLYR